MQRDAVDELELVGEHLFAVVAGREHKLDAGVALVRLQVCARARHLPRHVARKAVLLHLAGAELHEGAAYEVRRVMGLCVLVCLVKHNTGAHPAHASNMRDMGAILRQPP